MSDVVLSGRARACARMHARTHARTVSSVILFDSLSAAVFRRRVFQSENQKKTKEHCRTQLWFDVQRLLSLHTARSCRYLLSRDIPNYRQSPVTAIAKVLIITNLVFFTDHGLPINHPPPPRPSTPPPPHTHTHIHTHTHTRTLTRATAGNTDTYTTLRHTTHHHTTMNSPTRTGFDNIELSFSST